MERRSIRPEIAPPRVAFCDIEQTRSDSGASSMTSENMNSYLHQSPNDRCMPWTNQKHNKYLDYLEASFVRHLHSRMDSPARCTKHTEREGNSMYQNILFNLHKTSKEVDSVPDGQYHKINFGKDQAHPYTVAQAQSLHVIEHQLIHAVKDSSTDLQELCKLHSQDKNLKRMESNCYRQSRLEDCHLGKLCSPSSDESVIEGTDQNFVDEDCQMHSYRASGAKKLKTETLEDTLNTDQIPFGELYPPSVLTHSSPEGEGGETNEER